MAANTASMNVVSAPNPWTTGMRGTSLSRGRAGNGSSSMLAIISSVTFKVSVRGAAGGAVGGAAAEGTTTGYGVHRVTVQTPREMAPVISATPIQASGSHFVLTKPAQITSPARAALAWLNTT